MDQGWNTAAGKTIEEARRYRCLGITFAHCPSSEEVEALRDASAACLVEPMAWGEDAARADFERGHRLTRLSIRWAILSITLSLIGWGGQIILWMVR